MSAQVWVEPARGGFRLCGVGRVPGSTWREAHLHLTRGEAQAALAAAIELAAGASSMVPAVALPASLARRGAPASSGLRAPTVGRLVGAASPGVSAVPTPQLPVGAVPRAERAVVAGHLSTGGANERTRAAERTTTREFEINHS